MDDQMLEFLLDQRVKMYAGESDQQKAILAKLDQLILAELGKSDEPARNASDDDIPF